MVAAQKVAAATLAGCGRSTGGASRSGRERPAPWRGCGTAPDLGWRRLDSGLPNAYAASTARELRRTTEILLIGVSDEFEKIVNRLGEPTGTTGDE
jgi:hypothetical protein